MSKLTLEINEANQAQFGPCECCGQMTRRVWGYVRDHGDAYAVYYVEWTPGHPSRKANFDLILGEWGDGTSASDRKAAALEYRFLESGPAFVVMDAQIRPVARSSLVSRALRREEIIGTPLAAEIFAICDVIHLNDARISALAAASA